MSSTHTVERGDWIGAIAERYGFGHWSLIWDHALNEGLRALRGSPDLIAVGDQVQIPDPYQRRGVEVPTGHRALFTVRPAVDLLRLRIHGLGSFIDAFGPVDFKLEVGSVTLQGKLETEGQELSVTLEPTATKATLTLMGTDTHEFLVGGLGPVSDEKGAHARLINLGFRGDFQSGGEQGPEPTIDQAADPLSEALTTFQARHNLDRTGTLDAPTKATLKTEYEG